MKINHWWLVTALTAAMAFPVLTGSAQEQRRDAPPGGRDQQNGRGRGGFDPAQMRERFNNMIKEQLEITDDTEWKAVQPLVQKVMDARMATFSGGRGGFGMFRGRGPEGDRGGDRGGDRPSPFGQANPEADALKRAIDGKASNSELKAAVTKYAESRKAKQAELEKAQDDLRKVLSVRQEAIATLNGWL